MRSLVRQSFALCFLMALHSAAFAAPPSPEVTVINTEAEPVPVINVDSAQALPYRCTGTASVDPGIGAVSFSCPPVPTGYRLTVEFVSVKLATSHNNQAWISFGAGSSATDDDKIFLVPVRVLVIPAINEDWLIVSQEVTFHAEAEDDLALHSNRVDVPSSASYGWTIEGSLIAITP